MCGGHSPAGYRRAVRSANGWYGWQLDPDATATTLAALAAAEQRHGRPPELGDLEITITPPPDCDAAMARRYAEVGVHRLVVQPRTSDGTEIDDLIEATAPLIATL